MASTLAKHDLDLKLAELKINGYTMFEDLVSAEKIDRVHDAFMPLLDAVKDREDPIESGDRRKGEGRLQNVNRYTVEVPWQLPFADPEIYENPVILEILERYWGTSDFVMVLYSSNNPYPGSEYQYWHRDMPLIGGVQKCPIFGVKFPLVDTSEENGSFEVLPGSQFLNYPEYEGRYDEVIRAGEFPKHRLNMKRGTFWIQDVRPFHRGTPNRSDHARPELVICYSLPWYKDRRHVELTQNEFDGLSGRAKQLLANCWIVG
jgi:ectoine hydroxylase-related dioxygenase (phytanoyl-CoA dioxygenase family)